MEENAFNLYEFLKEFQTALVGIVGFAGVILTLFVNAKAVRKQHELELESRRTNVKKVVHADIKAMQDIVRRNLEHSGPDPGGSTAVPRISRVMTDTLLADLGLLNEAELEAAHKGLMALNDLQRKLVLVAYQVSDDFVYVDAAGYELVLAAYRGALPTLEAAVETLE